MIDALCTQGHHNLLFDVNGKLNLFRCRIIKIKQQKQYTEETEISFVRVYNRGRLGQYREIYSATNRWHSRRSN